MSPPTRSIATLFYTRCAELYAKVGAKIGMVMPHSTLHTGQHRKWRGGYYKQKGGRDTPSISLNLKVQEPWDLDNVVPNIFSDSKMPASVVFAQYIGTGQGTALAPGTVQIWRGNWQEDYGGISRTSETLHHDDGKFKSPYADLSSNGATIQDRRLFFVETLPHTASIPAANTTNVRPRLGNQDKVTYEGQLNQLEGVVHNDHLFDVYLGECIAPYIALDPLQAVLPIHRSIMTMPLNHDDCEGDKHKACRLDIGVLHPTMQRRWNHTSAMFHDAHKDQAINELYDRVNHQNTLTSQLEYLRGAITDGKTIRVAYTSAGQPTAAIIKENHAILENALFQTVCESESEAHYLIAIINSNELARQAKPLCPTNWAKKIRHLHKHGWKLPIPRYDTAGRLHARLSELGATAQQECQALIAQSDIMSKTCGRCPVPRCPQPAASRLATQ